MANTVPGASQRAWTDAQDEMLRMLMRANIPPREIAERLSRTPDQIVDRASELGINQTGAGI